MDIDEKAIESVKEAANSILINELKSFYLLGDTNEYDEFEPSKVDINNSSDFDVYKLACCTFAGYKTDEDEEKAFGIWDKMANAGQVESMIELSAYLFRNKKDEEAFAFLQNASNKGNKLAQFRLAICYFIGIGTTINGEKGFKIISSLAEDKYPNAVYMLGSFFFNDDTFANRDVKKGWAMIKEAASLGSPFAQYEVAIQMFNQQDKEHFKDVIALMEKAADGGDLRALYILSLAYAKGEGVEVDLKKAMSYLAQSYDGGFPLAIELMEKIKNSSEA